MLARNVFMTLKRNGKEIFFSVNAWNETFTIYELDGLRKKYYFREVPLTEITALNFQVDTEEQVVRKAKPLMKSLAFGAMSAVSGNDFYEGALIGAVSAQDKVKTHTYFSFGIEAKGKALRSKFEANDNQIKAYKKDFDYLKKALEKRGIV